MIYVVVAACAAAAVAAGARWLRVAQREHYLPVVTRFALRWWLARPENIGLVLVGLVGVAASTRWGWAALLPAIAQVGPIGLSVRGRTSKLAWTSRLRRLAIVSAALFAVALVSGVLLEQPIIPAGALMLLPFIVDLSLVALRPVERMIGAQWVKRARRKLDAIEPRVVAITGSYGKTTTKAYVAHLASGTLRTVASPASFNNTMGLARAINEGLNPGTELFVAEMGTYGPGEIAEMCSWIQPEVSAITAIGPVHLERFGSESRIVRAKAEILDGAKVGVICVDHPLLAQLASERSEAIEILDVSSGATGVVRVTDGKLFVHGGEVAEVPTHVYASNLATAVGICVALGLDMDSVVPRISGLTAPDHRQTVSVSEAGFEIIDDTFNSNPAGAKRALGILGRGTGVKAVVTPGMVELGPVQARENEAFAAAAAQSADHVVIVGRTNRAALLRGAAKGQASVTVVDTREEAVGWVRSNLGPGDAVLYENDLPDHYP